MLDSGSFPHNFACARRIKSFMSSVHRGKSAWFWRWISLISCITGGISVSVTDFTPGSGFQRVQILGLEINSKIVQKLWNPLAFDQMPASGVISNPAGRSISWCFLKWSFKLPSTDVSNKLSKRIKITFWVARCLHKRHWKGFAPTWIR